MTLRNGDAVGDVSQLIGVSVSAQYHGHIAVYPSNAINIAGLAGEVLAIVHRRDIGHDDVALGDHEGQIALSIPQMDSSDRGIPVSSLPRLHRAETTLRHRGRLSEHAL